MQDHPHCVMLGISFCGVGPICFVVFKINVSCNICHKDICTHYSAKFQLLTEIVKSLTIRHHIY